MLSATALILIALSVAGIVIAVVDASSRTSIFPAFNYPAGAVFVYGLSMTLVWLTRQVVPFALPAHFYRLRPVEADGSLYRQLGVHAFKRLLFKSGLQRLNLSARLSHGRTGLIAFERGIGDAETDHAIAFLVMIVITLYSAMHGWWAFASWLMLGNGVANVYPIMLQRMNRARLLPVLEKLRHRNVRPPV